jgi:four helix bundle protein
MGEIKSYRDLRVWQRSVDFAAQLYQTTATFPQSEMYGLTNQMRRASVSIASNIAEGHARPTKDYARFLAIALGSLNELETQLEISRRVGYLSDDAHATLTPELEIIGKQIINLRKTLR